MKFYVLRRVIYIYIYPPSVLPVFYIQCLKFFNTIPTKQVIKLPGSPNFLYFSTKKIYSTLVSSLVGSLSWWFNLQQQSETCESADYKILDLKTSVFFRQTCNIIETGYVVDYTKIVLYQITQVARSLIGNLLQQFVSNSSSQLLCPYLFSCKSI